MKKHWGEMFKTCPFCGNNLFKLGPKGGLSQNFECMLCGATFNHMGPFGVQLLTVPVVDWLSDSKKPKGGTAVSDGAGMLSNQNHRAAI